MARFATWSCLLVVLALALDHAEAAPAKSPHPPHPPPKPHSPPKPPAPPKKPAPAKKPNLDTAILQFALNLEYLEANFYSCAAFGTPLPANLTGGGPAPYNCTKALLSPMAQAYASSIAMDEMKHVALLRAVLGSSAVPQPQLDLGMAFAVAANVALNVTLKPSFTPYGDDILFYHGAFIFEDVGVTAYKGAAKLITNAAILDTAAGILAVEAYHGGSIRTLLFGYADSYVYPYGAQVVTIIQAISNLRAAVSNATDDQGLIGKNGTLIVAPADANAVAFGRTTTQVLAIVYLGGVHSGGFFPLGLHGPIH